MRYLLDTHAWVWLLEAGDTLPAKARNLLRDSKNVPLGVSIISAWEVARKESLGKIRFAIPCRDWLTRATEAAGLQVLPLSAAIAWESCHLPGEFHRDPADQIIVATARLQRLTLVTADRRLRAYSHVPTVWD